MISGKNIHKRYGTVEVLKGVDISVGKGEIVSIVGPSGSGKSTLLHILGTLDRSDSGYVEMHGARIEGALDTAIIPSGWLKRSLNALIDGILYGSLAAGLLVWLNGVYEPELTDIMLFLYGWMAFTVAGIIYYTAWEGATGRTPGKWLTGTKVFVAHNVTRPSWKRSLVRSLSRFIPFEPFSLFSARPVGWHDFFAGTVVASAGVPYRPNQAGTLSPAQLAFFRNKHIGFVFQFHHLLPEFSALENVCIPGWLAGRKKSEVKKEAEKLLTMLGLAHRMENKPNQLSGGEQQRVAVCRALINKPDIVFADEPTGNLDSANAQELHQLFFDLRKKFNQTFLIVTHNEELARLSDRVLYMKDGLIV